MEICCIAMLTKLLSNVLSFFMLLLAKSDGKNIDSRLLIFSRLSLSLVKMTDITGGRLNQLLLITVNSVMTNIKSLHVF